jgi:hypothetical protein
LREVVDPEFVKAPDRPRPQTGQQGIIDVSGRTGGGHGDQRIDGFHDGGAKPSCDIGKRFFRIPLELPQNVVFGG